MSRPITTPLVLLVAHLGAEPASIRAPAPSASGWRPVDPRPGGPAPGRPAPSRLARARSRACPRPRLASSWTELLARNPARPLAHPRSRPTPAAEPDPPAIIRLVPEHHLPKPSSLERLLRTSCSSIAGNCASPRPPSRTTFSHADRARPPARRIPGPIPGPLPRMSSLRCRLRPAQPQIVNPIVSRIIGPASGLSDANKTAPASPHQSAFPGLCVPLTVQDKPRS